ncbi:probable E3 ubiquitin-protein ligase RNF217 [Tanacetum coccineum]
MFQVGSCNVIVLNALGNEVVGDGWRAGAALRIYLDCSEGKNCEIMLCWDRLCFAVCALYHIHVAGGPQKEPVGPAVELHHKKKVCVGCWAVRVGLADGIGSDEWSGSQKGVEKPNAYFYSTGKRFDLVYCPNKECSELIMNEFSDGDVKRCVCPSCLKPFCYQCKAPWHDGYTCEETRDGNNVDFEVVCKKNRWNWKRCPKCRLVGLNFATRRTKEYHFCARFEYLSICVAQSNDDYYDVYDFMRGDDISLLQVASVNVRFSIPSTSNCIRFFAQHLDEPHQHRSEDYLSPRTRRELC